MSPKSARQVLASRAFSILEPQMKLCDLLPKRLKKQPEPKKGK